MPAAVSADLRRLTSLARVNGSPCSVLNSGLWLKPLTARYVSITAPGHSLLWVLPTHSLTPWRAWSVFDPFRDTWINEGC